MYCRCKIQQFTILSIHNTEVYTFLMLIPNLSPFHQKMHSFRYIDAPFFRFHNRILNMWVLGSSKGDEIGKNQCQFWLINVNVSFRLDIMSETGEEVQIHLPPLEDDDEGEDECEDENPPPPPPPIKCSVCSKDLAYFAGQLTNINRHEEKC